MTTTDSFTEVHDEAELRDLLGEPSQRVLDKDRDRLHDLDRQWLAASPFCLVATSAADGSCDVSPKGDPAGFVHVIDDRTIAIPERPGNRRADGYRNILSNPHVGLIFLVPGRGDTLRINGRARLVSDAPFFDDMVVRGHRPVLAHGRRDRAGLPPLRQGVPAGRSLGPVDLGRRRPAVARGDRTHPRAA